MSPAILVYAAVAAVLVLSALLHPAVFAAFVVVCFVLAVVL